MTMPSVKLELHDSLSGSGLNFGHGIDDINDVTTKICLTSSSSKAGPATSLKGSLLKGNRRATIAIPSDVNVDAPGSPTGTSTSAVDKRSKLLKKGSSKRMAPKIRKKTPRRATVASGRPSLQQDDADETKSKEELKALEEKINQLQTLLNQREKVITDQIEKIQKGTAKKKEKLDAKRRASQATSADIALGAKQQSQNLADSQKEVEDLKASNKSIRQELRKLVADTQSLVTENQNLESAKRDLKMENLRCSTLVDNRTKTYTKCTQAVPQYKDRIEECETELEKRDSMIESETKTRKIFENCVSRLIEKIRTECNDEKFVALMEDNFS